MIFATVKRRKQRLVSSLNEGAPTIFKSEQRDVERMKIEQNKSLPVPKDNAARFFAPLENRVQKSKDESEKLNLNPSGKHIPIISVTGTNGKTTVTRLIAHIFAQTGKTVGMTTTGGIYLGGEKIASGDTTGPKSARTVLENPATEIAVLETARGGIVRRGFGYENSDAAVLTNIQFDHIGQDGIESLENILQIKAQVAHRVAADGTIILNADDDLLVRLGNDPQLQTAGRRIVYFSLKPDQITLKRHISSGGTAITVRHNWIVEVARHSETPIIDISEIPIAFDGLAEFNISNALAATGACLAQNLEIEVIADALRSFDCDKNNSGRANLFEVDGAYVFLDYGHNPKAFESIAKMAAKLDDGARRISAVIAVPGDRATCLIEQAGRIAARYFHRIVIKEDADLRGRAPGETAEILRRAVADESPETECRVILDESEALRREITRLQEGDILICFYENFALVRDILARCDAQPTTTIKPLKTHPHYTLRQA